MTALQKSKRHFCQGYVVTLQAVQGCSQHGWDWENGAIASYLVSLYCSLAALTDDAAAVLE